MYKYSSLHVNYTLKSGEINKLEGSGQSNVTDCKRKVKV